MHVKQGEAKAQCKTGPSTDTWKYLENLVYRSGEFLGSGCIFMQYTIDWGGHKGGINGSNVPIEALSRMKFEDYANDDYDDDDDEDDDDDDDEGGGDDDNFEVLSRMKFEAYAGAPEYKHVIP